MRWLQPLAWWSLAGIAIPILIHLLARDRAPRLLFPSLRFLQVNQVAALRRRVVSDWPLLAVRVLIVAVSVAALAGPVFVSSARRASWNQRVIRAIVVPVEDRESVGPLIADESRTSFVAASFSSDVLAGALTEAVEWFRHQPPGAREVVIIGDLRDGALTDRELDVVPPFAGIRFLPVPRAAALPRAGLLALGDDADGNLVHYGVHVEADALTTRVRHDHVRDAQGPQLRILADPAAQDYADALTRAVLRDGVWLGTHGERRVTFAFRGAAGGALTGMRTPTTPWVQQALAASGVTGGENDGAMIAAVDMPVTDSGAPELVAHIARVVFSERFEPFEPRRVTPARLARWSRPFGESPSDAPLADEGDRRWFWGAVLILLALEQFARARRRSRDSVEPGAVEKRVA
jgi:Aerotolerance regulator N-terminal